MGKNKIGIILTILVIAVVLLAIYLGNSLAKKTATLHSNANNIQTNTIFEMYENNIYEKENIIVVDETNPVVNNEITNTNTYVNSSVNTTTSIEENSSNKEQRAIELVKKEWGEDDSVYFYVDEVGENKKYVISVRYKDNTNAIAWYEVDLNTNMVREK